MLSEVLDITSQTRVAHQPVVQSSVASQEEKGGQQQEWRGRKYGQECAEYSQCQRDESKYGEDDIHSEVVQNLLLFRYLRVYLRITAAISPPRTRVMIT